MEPKIKHNKAFLLRPAGKDYLWGGQRLKQEFNKNLALNPLAETWECSTHDDGLSYVQSGEYLNLSLKEVLKAHPEYLGSRHKNMTDLPILIKFIDASRDLSIQVHPSDAYAQKYEGGQLGKSEMWYVLDATEDAKLIYGLKRSCTKEELIEATRTGNLKPYLQSIKVKKDDVFYIEAGTIHAIGGGCLIVEIQENSNLTYRLYDYDRIDKDGKKRALQLEKALAVADLAKTKEPKQPLRVLKYQPGVAKELLSRCKYFEVYRLLVNGGKDKEIVYQSDSLAFRVLLCLNGQGNYLFEKENLHYQKGDCLFIPANSYQIKITGQGQFLDIRA